MSTYMTRKGLALGAGLALVGAGLVATTPAYAAAELILEPNAGTEYAMIAGETFTLKVYGNAEFLASNGSQIRLKVENDGGASFDTFKINGSQLDDNYADGSTEYAADGGHTTNGNSIKFTGVSGGTAAKVGTSDGDEAILGLGDSRDALDSGSTSLMTAPATLSFKNATVTAGTPEKLKVTAWADADSDGVIDAGEITSATRTVSFYNEADTDILPSISATPFSGDNTMKVSWDYGIINEAQLPLANVGVDVVNTKLAADHSIDQGVEDNDGIFTDTTTSGANVARNTSKTKFEVTVDNEPTTDSTKVVFGTTGDFSSFKIAAAYDSGGTLVDDTDEVFPASTEVTVAVLARTLDTTNSKANLVTSGDATITTDGSAGTVRTGSAFNVALALKDGSTPAKVLPTIATSVTVSTDVTLSASKYLTIDGVAYTSDADLAAAEWTENTNISGVASIAIQPTGFVEDDKITVDYVAQGHDFTNVVVTLKDAAYQMNFVAGNEADSSGPQGYDPAIAIGGSYTFSLAVADQFGVAAPNGAYNISVTRAQKTNTANRTTAAAFAAVQEVVDGVATFTLKDNGAGAGTDTITATLVGALSNGEGADFDLTYTTEAVVTPSVLTLTDNWDGTADTDVSINATSVPSFHPYLHTGTVAPTVANNFDAGSDGSGTNDTTLTFSGTVTNAASAGLEAQMVSLSAAGVTFAYTDGESKVIYSRDSIVVPTSAGGSYSVKAYSDATGGSIKVTASVGSLTKSQTVTFAGGAADAFTVTTPSQSAPGKTVDVIVDVKDANGNPVQGASVTLSSTGPGYLINTTGTTLSTGKYTTKLLLGANDTGTAIVSVTMTVDGVETTKTSSVVVSNNPAATADAKVNAGSFKGYVAVYAKGYQGSRLSAKIGNDWVIVPALASNFERVVDFTGAGVDIAVRIYIDRVLMDTINLTTK